MKSDEIKEQYVDFHKTYPVNSFLLGTFTFGVENRVHLIAGSYQEH